LDVDAETVVEVGKSLLFALMLLVLGVVVVVVVVLLDMLWFRVDFFLDSEV
jgi:hypothetical protein